MWLRIILIWLCLGTLALAGQNVVVLLDDSGSMGDALRSNRGLRKIDAAKRALLTVLEQVPAEAQVGVLALNGARGAGGWTIPLGPLQPAQMRRAIQQISADGGTPLGQFMKIAADELLKLRGQQKYGSYRLLIVTDGEANDQPLVELFLPQILARGVTVDVIGVDMKQDHSLATRVSSYRRADDPQSLTRAIEESLAESSLDDQDPDEQSDFELLAALPDEMALAAVQQLCQLDNRPIGRQAEEVTDSNIDAPPFSQPGPRVVPERGCGPQRLLTWLILAMVLVLALRVVTQIMRRR